MPSNECHTITQSHVRQITKAFPHTQASVALTGVSTYTQTINTVVTLRIYWYFCAHVQWTFHNQSQPSEILIINQPSGSSIDPGE